jgi:hypothetical protein
MTTTDISSPLLLLFPDKRTLLASNCAPAIVGPKALTLGHSARSASTRPSTRGCSGPITTMSAPTLLTYSTIDELSMYDVVDVDVAIARPYTSTAFRTFPPSIMVPPFPG